MSNGPYHMFQTEFFPVIVMFIIDKTNLLQSLILTTHAIQILSVFSIRTTTIILINNTLITDTMKIVTKFANLLRNENSKIALVDLCHQGYFNHVASESAATSTFCTV